MILQPPPMCSIDTTIVLKFTEERKICASKSIWDLEDSTFSMAPMSSINTTIAANFTKERKFTWALKSKVWDLGISHCPWFLVNSSILCSPPHVHFSFFATLFRVFIINLVVLLLSLNTWWQTRDLCSFHRGYTQWEHGDLGWLQ